MISLREKRMIALIAAKSQNNVIGKGGRIPWDIPGELRQFRELTRGNIVIMGRISYEEIGHPLPERENFVISRSREFSGERLRSFPELPEALRYAEEYYPEKEIYIAGGAGLFAEALPLADRMYLTEIATAVVDGEVFFPAFDPSDFIRETGAWEGEGISYRRILYLRKH